MKKMISFLAGMLLFAAAGRAQQVNEETIKISKQEVSGFVATSEYNTDEIEQAIKGKLDAAGVKKHSKKKKFYTYKGITVPEISANKIDLYYKVQKKKHKSRIYFVVSKGYDNYVTTANDATTAAGITTFLTQVDATVAHNREVAQKEEEVRLSNEKLEREKAEIKRAEEEKKKKEQELEALKNNK